MAKYTSDDVNRISERLRRAKDRSRPAHFLIGAGCSLTAEIPSAAEIVKIIHEKYPAQCGDLTDANRDSYGACMGLLSINERRDLIKPLLDKAKVNWGHIALAQMIGSGFVGRVLSVNFDLVLENACGLLGLQPAVYDFGIAPASDATLIVSPAICHLHGQSYGFILLNTDDETRQHRDKLRPVLLDSMRTAPLIVIGYSGSADGVFQTLIDDFEVRESLYWVGYASDASAHIRPLFEKRLARYLGEADFDRFMIDLAQALECWPPPLFADPLGQLRRELKPVVPYPVGETGGEVDIVADLRSKLTGWRQRLRARERSFAPVRSAFMKGDYPAADCAIRMLTATERADLSREELEITIWSLLEYALLRREQAMRASEEADAKRLFAEANEACEHALVIKPDSHEALNNWGIVQHGQAKRASEPDASRLFAEGGDKYARALAIKPEKHEALNNWGALLSEQARRANGEDASRLFVQAGAKYEAALTIKPDKYQALGNWGAMLVEQGRRASGEERERLFIEAERKLLSVSDLYKAKTYNLACLAALRNQREKCRDYLNETKARGALPPKNHLNGDADLDSIRDELWFRELLASLDD